MWSRTCLIIAALLFNHTVVADSDTTISIRYLSPELTQQIVATAVSTCTEKGYRVSAAMVNRDGTLAAFLRNPLSGPHTEEVAQRKAFSSATFQTTTEQMQDRQEIRHASRILLVKGGVPIEIGGHFYGAVAVSGATEDDDAVCANAGIDVIREQLEFAE